MPPSLLDTNVLVHLLEGEPPNRAQAATALLRQAEAGQVSLLISPMVFFEVAFTLHRRSHYDRSTTAQALRDVLALKGLSIDDRELLAQAVEVFATIGGLSFADAYNAAYMRRRSIAAVYSWDTDFDRIDGLTRVEPA